MDQEFERFRKFIKRAYGSPKLDSPEGEELKELCDNHARENTPGEIGEENIIAVHPYYSEFHWGNWDNKQTAREKRLPQVKRLEEVMRKSNGYFKRILFEEYAAYAKRSHQLVEEGVIDKVIFTQNAYGLVLNSSDLEPFSQSKANYVGGSYGYQCVKGIINEIRKYAPFFSIRPIRNAILFNEPSFFDKLSVMGQRNAHIEGHRNTSFYIPDKIYSLTRGVRHKRLIAKT